MRDISKTTKEFEKAIFTLLEHKNYHDITINEICALANKTKMTFYHYYKDKHTLLAEASVNLVNKEYNDEYKRILKRETNLEEIEYQAVLVTYDLIAKHYNQIQNLIYKGDTLALEIFKNALADNYKRYIFETVNSAGYDIPVDYISIFFFEGLFHTCLYYANQLMNNKNKKKTRDDAKKTCRLLAKISIALIE